jgi:hypothetical protein
LRAGHRGADHAAAEEADVAVIEAKNCPP